jgi:hypothetical protein
VGVVGDDRVNVDAMLLPSWRTPTAAEAAQAREQRRGSYATIAASAILMVTSMMQLFGGGHVFGTLRAAFGVTLVVAAGLHIYAGTRLWKRRAAAKQAGSR